MFDQQDTKGALFDEWPDRYDKWFETPLGALVKRYERELLLDLLNPRHGEMILDAGCGTGVFTLDILSFGPRVIGLDISGPMLVRAGQKAGEFPFGGVMADMMLLPFADGVFDKVVSVTALEFIADGKGAVRELFRVTRKGGAIVVATLNRLSPWATDRQHEVKKGKSIFERVIFRSPDDMRSLAAADAVVKTAIHFRKNDDPAKAPEIERQGQRRGLMTGAFVAARWEKR